MALKVSLRCTVGDKVLRGQPLTRGRGKMLPVHAPTSGTVYGYCAPTLRLILQL
ncbi:hypothetical protein ACLK1S_10230 [Escherichia coli]